MYLGHLVRGSCRRGRQHHSCQAPLPSPPPVLDPLVVGARRVFEYSTSRQSAMRDFSGSEEDRAAAVAAAAAAAVAAAKRSLSSVPHPSHTV